MTRFTSLLGTAGVAFLLMGAPLLAQDITVDYDHSYQFNKMQSYSWDKLEATDPLLEPRLAAAVDHVIQGYGFNETSKDKKGDVIITAVVAKNSRQYVAFYRSATDLDWHRGWGGGGFSESATSLRQLHGGTLVVDVYDGATGKLVWRGTAAEGIAPKEKTNQDNVDKAVNKMFANFPPKSGGSMPPNQQEVPPSPSSTPLTSPN